MEVPTFPSWTVLLEPCAAGCEMIFQSHQYQNIRAGSAPHQMNQLFQPGCFPGQQAALDDGRAWQEHGHVPQHSQLSPLGSWAPQSVLPLLGKGTGSKLLNSNSHLWSSFLLLFAAEFGSLLSE